MTGFAEVIARDRSVDIAKDLIILRHMPATQIAKITRLDNQTVLDLADELGVELPADPDAS